LFRSALKNLVNASSRLRRSTATWCLRGFVRVNFSFQPLLLTPRSGNATSMPYEPPPELAALSLAEIAALVEARELPPLGDWSPAREGDSEMRIAADGRWFHQGGG
jgi:hypothetical protein